jgi:hypothetical protein
MFARGLSCGPGDVATTSADARTGGLDLAGELRASQMPGTWHGLWGWRRRLPVERRVGRQRVLGGLTLAFSFPMPYGSGKARVFGAARRADFRSAKGWPPAGFAVVDGPEDREHCFSYSLTHGGPDHAESIKQAVDIGARDPGRAYQGLPAGGRLPAATGVFGAFNGQMLPLGARISDNGLRRPRCR